MAGSATFPCYSRWRLFEPRLVGKFFIQGVKIALHTLLNFYFYINPAFSWYVGWNVASVRSHGFSIYKAASYTLFHDFIKGFLKKVALLPFACPGFAECGVIWDGVIQFESTEPSVGDVELNFLYQPPLWFDAIQISNQEHFEHTDRVDRWTACCRIIWCQKIIDEIKGYHPLDLPQQVGFWNQWLYIYENHCQLSALASHHATSLL